MKATQIFVEPGGGSIRFFTALVEMLHAIPFVRINRTVTKYPRGIAGSWPYFSQGETNSYENEEFFFKS